MPDIFKPKALKLLNIKHPCIIFVRNKEHFIYVPIDSIIVQRILLIASENQQL